MSFSSFGLDSTLLATLAQEGYSTPTPIQTQAIPVVMEGRDLFGLAQTGTGKTAAFALPILHRYHHQKKSPLHGSRGRRGPRCLVLTPTRELAMQVAESFTTYGRKTQLGVAVIYGGVGQAPQKEALRRRPEILVATPGRLLDLMGQGDVDLGSVDVFILDEADRMFDMGFIHDIRKVVAKLPTERQTLLFSATMPEEIAQLAKGILRNPARVEVTPAHRTADTIAQMIYFVSPKERIPLIKHLLEEKNISRTIVFTRMKHVANRVAEALRKDGIAAEAFHANKSQSARVRALSGFKSGEVRVLVATDIAARGLDVDDVEVVVNYDLPEVPETYVHRIGRSGRAGKVGMSWSLCTLEQHELLQDIERVTQVRPELVSEHPCADAGSRGCHEAHLAFRERLEKGSSGKSTRRTENSASKAAPAARRPKPQAAHPEKKRESTSTRTAHPERKQEKSSHRNPARERVSQEQKPHRSPERRSEAPRTLLPQTPATPPQVPAVTAPEKEEGSETRQSGIHSVLARLGFKKKR